MVCWFLFLVSTRFGQNLDLVENGQAEEESDGEGLVQPVVVEVKLVGKLHDLSPGGVGVRKWPAGHCEMRLKMPAQK